MCICVCVCVSFSSHPLEQGAMYMQQAVITSDGRNTVSVTYKHTHAQHTHTHTHTMYLTYSPFCMIQVYERKERLRDTSGNDRMALERGANDRAKLRVRHKSAGSSDFREEVHYRNVPHGKQASNYA